MRKLRACLFFCAVVGGAFGVLAAEPLRYEPVVIRLSGVIVIDAFFGPPGYGEDPENDSIQRMPLLVLDEPVAVECHPHIRMSDDNFRRLQLANMGPDIWARTWRHVVLEGRLFQAEWGYHHTDIVMWVEQLVSSP